MILNNPHSSTFLGDLVVLRNEKENLDKLTDWWVDFLFDYDPCTMVRFPYSRFVCDVERFRENDPMESIGQGVIYRKDIEGFKIKRNISDEQTYELYDQYHKSLMTHVNFNLGLFDKVIVVDCHTFTSESKYDPDICIGTDENRTPIELSNIISDHFNYYSYNVKFNDPYKGTIIPRGHEDSPDVSSVMIEVNKDLYINNSSNFNKTQKIIWEVLKKIDDYEWINS